MSEQEPLTQAGPAFARAIAEHIDRPVPDAAVGRYVVDVYESGGLLVWYPESDGVRLDCDSDTAKNIRGLLLALRAGAIA
jgi:hypothetical protein